MNHIKNFNQLNNRYVILRHGESRANVQEIIISNIEDGIKEEYSLTENGENQVRVSIQNAKDNLSLDSSVIIYSSPFSRCKKTAEIAKEILGVKDEIIIDERLGERWFGALDKTHANNYEKVWNADKGNSQPIENEEAAESVEERTTSLIAELEKAHVGKTFLLVSHGDVLQILEVCFKKMPANTHRSIVPLERAEVRELTVK